MTEYTIVMDSDEYQTHCMAGRYSRYKSTFKMSKTDTVLLVNAESGERTRKRIVRKYGEKSAGDWIYHYLLEPACDIREHRSDCYNCGHSLIWDSDAQDTDPEDGKEYLYHFLHCDHCNSKITYKVPL